jgi:uncharacterized glyoxalase superfamily protein PhnB
MPAKKKATKVRAKSATKSAKPAAKRRAKKAASAPRQAVVPHLVVRGAAKAIDFYKKAFGAEEKMRLPGPDGRLMHGAVSINGAMVMLVDEMPEHGALSPLSLKGSPVTVHLNVDDVDKFFARAVKAGATVRMPVADMFWGDRYGMLQDPFGHTWSIATHKRDMTADQIKKAMSAEMRP